MGAIVLSILSECGQINTAVDEKVVFIRRNSGETYCNGDIIEEMSKDTKLKKYYMALLQNPSKIGCIIL